ncbi:TOTE conflict system archaeo-eukaryotic primase domain-containing protein [Lapidilactobacillus bayanensis]|uniref:TOTE conflict system archaeo-eukaryotic primase domain-containing protein n=1 Tax=Lapidilactobacillus bayanensis TaxID=2485998 RepID=UPI000F795F83|nr:DEAD/DEAH box helicase family protein [Lapidilactobacillus bayanensis]
MEIKKGRYYSKNCKIVDVLHIAYDLEQKQYVVVFVVEKDDTIYVISKTRFMANMVKPQTESSQFSHLNEQVMLFKKLFRSRHDVYAIEYFKNGERKFTPDRVFGKRDQYKQLTDQVIRDHLTGKKMIGLFPLDKDSTCNFLVLDIDKVNWQAITKSIVSIAKSVGLQIEVELSRSGNGSHLWILFSESISAKTARQLGSTILNIAMYQNPGMSFDAFDRMFPNQDFIPRGGFGNLISAPLQGKRAAENCSVFLDDQLLPIQNQWEYLSKVKQYTLDEVNEFQGTLSAKCQLTKNIEQQDLRESDDEKYPDLQVNKDAVLHIPTKKLSAYQIAELKRMATFSNPEFYKLQNQRRSTYRVPRYLSTFSQNENELSFPRGLEGSLVALTKAKIIDKTNSGHILQMTFKGVLKSDQQHAFNALKNETTGIISARTGFGKTILGIALISDRKVSTLILVHTTQLAEQWKDSLENFLDLKNEPFQEYTPKGRVKKKPKIGEMYGQKFMRSGNVDVATFQSLVKRHDLEAILSDYGMVIIDEVHHAAAKTYEHLIERIPAKYIYGFSATVKRSDKLEKITYMRIGDIKYETAKIDEKYLNSVSYVLHSRFTSINELGNEALNNTINENYKLIVNSKDRNEQIINDIKQNYHDKRHIIVLTERLTHIDRLIELLRREKISYYELSGRQKDKLNRTIIENIKNDTDTYIILATGKYAGEGFDVPSIDTLILTMPISWSGRLQQYIGRMNRDLDTKSELRVYDYVDYAIPMFNKMYQKRLKLYAKLNYRLFDDGENRFSLLYQENNFLVQLKDDINDVDKQIIISSSVKVVKWIKSMSKNHDMRLIIAKSTRTEYVIIDNIVWYGDIGKAFNNYNAILLRIVNAELAQRLMELDSSNVLN